MSKKTYYMVEYEGVVRNKEGTIYQSLPEEIFDTLLAFTLENEEQAKLFTVQMKNNIGPVIIAKNYIGVVALKEGIQIEILPKIFSENKTSLRELKQILMEMIRFVYQLPFKSIQTAKIDWTKNTLFDLFIQLFVDEINRLLKQGLSSDYVLIEENADFLKGKWLIEKQLQKNMARQDKFYIQEDQYLIDALENQVIKTTIVYLQDKVFEETKKRQLQELLLFFREVKVIDLRKISFKALKKEQKNPFYTQVLTWCEIFLEEKCFSVYSGKYIVSAFLLPMERLFEEYVSKKMKWYLEENYFVYLQNSQKFLFNVPNFSFALRPDIVVVSKENGQTVILDTKWKLLDRNGKNYQILPADMYQMAVYQRKYKAKKVILVYPLVEGLEEKSIFYRDEDNLQIEIVFIDFYQLKKSIGNLIQKIVD